MMLQEELTQRGISAENIIYINFESMEYSDLDNAKRLYSFVKSKITNNLTYYILLDEIQEVKSWEKAINSFLVDFKADIYIQVQIQTYYPLSSPPTLQEDILKSM